MQEYSGAHRGAWCPNNGIIFHLLPACAATDDRRAATSQHSSVVFVASYAQQE